MLQSLFEMLCFYLADAFRLFRETASDMGTVDDILEESGYELFLRCHGMNVGG